jgi:3,4-dihydroxy 2-butanone 4-phosphate synthase/GTP cyclohydrolase II
MEGCSTVDANIALRLIVDARHSTAASDILRDFGIESIRLRINNPDKVKWLIARGVEVQQIPHDHDHCKESAAYLETKRDKMRHTTITCEIPSTEESS